MRKVTRARTWFGIALLPLWTSCSVSVALTGGEILEEIDEIVRIDGTGSERVVVYAQRARVSSWYMHNGMLQPIRGPLAWIFGRRTEMTLENPGAHVRELLAELPDETGAQLMLCGAAASRFGWLAELDGNPQTRILAIDGLSKICRQLDLKPFDGSFFDGNMPIDPKVLERARAGIRAARRSARGETDHGNLAPLQKALQEVVSAPLFRWDERLLLIENLGGLHVEETNAEARAMIRTALRRSIEHAVRAILLGTIKGRDRRFAEVRLCAMEQIRRLGGPRTVPLMLATMAATPSQRAANLPTFDPDPLVRLRLIHYCGQLSGELAHTVVQLPGRQEWEASSASEFLARLVLTERDYYSKLRTPAIVALSWCLGRKTIDPNPAWVRQWNDSQP